MSHMVALTPRLFPQHPHYEKVDPDTQQKLISSMENALLKSVWRFIQSSQYIFSSLPNMSIQKSKIGGSGEVRAQTPNSPL